MTYRGYQHDESARVSARRRIHFAQRSLLAIALCLLVGVAAAGCADDSDEEENNAGEDEISLTEDEFSEASQIYFDRCAGCHGTLRTGATGPSLEAERMTPFGTSGLTHILANGTDGGMPAYGTTNLLTDEEIDLVAKFLQLPAPEPPERPLSMIKDSWELHVEPDARPDAPEHDRNWENFFGVILRDAGQVAIVDGDTHELIKVVDTGFAVHILRSSADGRYFYSVGRDGRVTMIDLWSEEPTTVAEAQGCFDARSVDASKYNDVEAGIDYTGKYIIEGCYWPAQYVIMDGQTLEPLEVVEVPMQVIGDGEELQENRAAAIVASHDDPVWVMNLKESGHVAIVDYSEPGFPITTAIETERFLHDGGWDITGRYFMTAANQSNKMVIVDVQEQRLEATFETGTLPHPGRGANWIDPELGPVNATPHLGENLLAIYGTDPVEHPENAWKVLREVEVPEGGLFVKTHDNSPWVWIDATMNTDAETARSVCAYSKADLELEKCFEVADRGAAVHFEYNREGTELWVSVWHEQGELVIFNNDLEEVERITGDWLVTPTGKFNVYNTAYDIY